MKLTMGQNPSKRAKDGDVKYFLTPKCPMLLYSINGHHTTYKNYFIRYVEEDDKLI